jgi:methionyl aminopeptidase
MDLPHYRDVKAPDPECMDEAGRIAARMHDRLKLMIEPDQSTLELDRVAREILRDEGAKPAFESFGEDDHAITVSINENLIHTYPEPEVIIEDGDLVSVDLGASYEGHYSDTAVTHLAGEPTSSDHVELIERTRSALYAGILEATAGNTLRDIGEAIEKKSGDFGLVTNWSGHFIGRDLHLAPRVHNTAESNRPFQLERGMTLAIEPILTLTPDARTLKRSSGGTIRTNSGEPGAHFEHTIRVGRDRAEILTAREDEPDRL